MLGVRKLMDWTRDMDAFIANLIFDGFTQNAAFASGIQAVSHGTDELRTRSCHAKWTSVCAIVIFKVALKVSVKQGPRATKRQRLG